ncbi:Hypothetical protein A7982_05693 [Minicystis rosea]|nr:Hypothetical protein A7982_05693 [Minicystis rosea]
MFQTILLVLREQENSESTYTPVSDMKRSPAWPSVIPRQPS